MNSNIGPFSLLPQSFFIIVRKNCITRGKYKTKKPVERYIWKEKSVLLCRDFIYFYIFFSPGTHTRPPSNIIFHTSTLGTFFSVSLNLQNEHVPSFDISSAHPFRVCACSLVRSTYSTTLPACCKCLRTNLLVILYVIRIDLSFFPFCSLVFFLLARVTYLIV